MRLGSKDASPSLGSSSSSSGPAGDTKAGSTLKVKGAGSGVGDCGEVMGLMAGTLGEGVEGQVGKHSWDGMTFSCPGDSSSRIYGGAWRHIRARRYFRRPRTNSAHAPGRPQPEARDPGAVTGFYWPYSDRSEN